MVATRLLLLLFHPLLVAPISGRTMDEQSDEDVYDDTFDDTFEDLDQLSKAGTALCSAASGMLFPAPAVPVTAASAQGGATAAIRALLMLQTASLAFEDVGRQQNETLSQFVADPINFLHQRTAEDFEDACGHVHDAAGLRWEEPCCSTNECILNWLQRGGDVADDIMTFRARALLLRDEKKAATNAIQTRTQESIDRNLTKGSKRRERKRGVKAPLSHRRQQCYVEVHSHPPVRLFQLFQYNPPRIPPVVKARLCQHSSI